ncbi:hypothetical protein HPB52_000153 [Rhipicephalus sanguineus]|uniref:Uncharacterized protein n=1 Tax=Rhipicephalus sanguineus TaxID=34632 RepID=A0A9D4PFI1_RHISA|nr:hypothetical protein HPB52_000153 [Rhipicephalus sanguineus]
MTSQMEICDVIMMSQISKICDIMTSHYVTSPDDVITWHRRLIKGVSSPRKARSGRPLPSSRPISLLVHDGSGLFWEPDERVTHLSIGFGQFLGHDLGFTPFLRLSPLELKMGEHPQETA